MTMLWADVPPEQRRASHHDAFRGCPYAVRLASWEVERRGGDGYRRCGNVPFRDGLACWNHDPSRDRDRDQDRGKGMVSRVRNLCLWDVGLGFGKPIAALRSLSDGQLMTLRQVGPATAAVVREIRDTWTDEQIAAFLGISLQQCRAEPDPPPAPPCVSPHGSLSWLGG